MINFTELRKNNLSFVMDATNMVEYKKWAYGQICEKCGAKASERPRDKNGNCIDWWITETLCGKNHE